MTEINADGNVVLSSLPQPQRDMVFRQIEGQGLLVYEDRDDGPCAGFDELWVLLISAGLPCSAAWPH